MNKLDMIHEVCDYVEEQLTHDGVYMTCSDCGVEKIKYVCSVSLKDMTVHCGCVERLNSR